MPIAIMLDIGQFLSVVAKYCEAGCIAESTLSTRLFNDGKRIASIRAGGDIGARKLGAAMLWLSLNWPQAAEWPDEVRRPTAEAAE